MLAAKEKVFRKLCAEAHACVVCPDLAKRKAVLGPLNGSINPKVLFIAEAPGRQGADRTRRPFYGDKSGENFDRLLDSIKLSREQIFITNAVMCSPRTATDANRKPTKSEMKNCSNFLRRQIELINPRLIATLGSVALEALKLVEYHQYSLKNVGEILRWNDRLLVPLFHPSPQVIASHRRIEQQLEDFKSLARALRKSR
jgi:uracil-DNA glycosylase family 4